MDNLHEWISNLPPWLNLKLCGAVILVGAGLWFLFRVMGEVVKILIALAVIGAGLFLFAKFMQWL